MHTCSFTVSAAEWSLLHFNCLWLGAVEAYEAYVYVLLVLEVSGANLEISSLSLGTRHLRQVAQIS